MPDISLFHGNPQTLSTENYPTPPLDRGGKGKKGSIHIFADKQFMQNPISVIQEMFKCVGCVGLSLSLVVYTCQGPYTSQPRYACQFWCRGLLIPHQMPPAFNRALKYTSERVLSA